MSVQYTGKTRGGRSARLGFEFRRVPPPGRAVILPRRMPVVRGSEADGPRSAGVMQQIAVLLSQLVLPGTEAFYSAMHLLAACEPGTLSSSGTVSDARS